MRRVPFGLTVYFANASIDTGPLIAERAIPPQFGVEHFKVESERPILEGTRELLAAIEQAERGEMRTYRKPGVPGPLYSLVGPTDYMRVARR